MDRLIKRFDATVDDDLMRCDQRGVAYQANMRAGRVKYDSSYLARVEAYEGGAIAQAVNAGRCALLARHLERRANVLDIGAGSGAFVRAARAQGFEAMGFEVIPEAAVALRLAGLYSEEYTGADALTLWDSLEHMEDPENYLKRVRKGAHVFVSLPIFADLGRIRESRHYRPGEHLFYFTHQGFVDYMALYGFRLLEASAHETDAGRENIGAFAFCRDLPDFGDHVVLYREMHSTRFYGSSATELHLATIASVVKARAPRTILDYGCGRSDLAAHFWLDGARRIERFDPAIPTYKTMPAGRFDLVLACDVLEHIPMSGVDRVPRCSPSAPSRRGPSCRTAAMHTSRC